MSILAEKMQSIKDSPTLAFSQLAEQLKAKGEPVLNLTAGEPDFPTPLWIQDAAIAAIQSGQTKYTPVAGTLALRQAIVEKFARENQLHFTVDEIQVTSGSKQALFNALFVSLNPEDEVIVPAPYWVSYPDMVRLAGGSVVFVTCTENEGFKLTPEKLEQAITPKTKWCMLCSPNNPSGAMYNRAELEALAQTLRRYPWVWILCDDIYEHLVYDNLEFFTLAQIAPDLKSRIATTNGVSKAYSMTGWRIGYCAAPKELIRSMNILQSQNTTCASSISQAAAVAALTQDQSFLPNWRLNYQKRRDQMLEGIQNIPGLSCQKPQGAFYLYINCADLIGKRCADGQALMNDYDVSMYLLDKAKVVTVPGQAFGLSPFFRISYAVSPQILEKALVQMGQACALLT